MNESNAASVWPEEDFLHWQFIHAAQCLIAAIVRLGVGSGPINDEEIADIDRCKLELKRCESKKNAEPVRHLGFEPRIFGS
jgi:hypothetical protein